jgi:hypothetical protein
MMDIQWVQLPKKVEAKIITDVFGRINKKVVASVLGNICIVHPELKEVMERLDSLYVIRRKETYQTLMDGVLEKEKWGALSRKNFYQIYTFDKPEGYSVTGLTFDKERMVMINLHQLFQSADEYAKYLSSNESIQRRDYRYFEQDCHYDNFKEIISNKYEAVNFLFWNTLFQQIRHFQQSIQDVDMTEYGYKEEKSVTLNDVIGFSKYMYQNFVGNEKPIQ